MYKLNETTALVQTLDFFTPIVDDPRIFGRAAAANSLSDVYAMGGRPITAMNVVCFPIKKLGVAMLRSILEGGLDIMRKAGVALIGGHSVEDDEPKYGLSVTGLVHPDEIMTNSGLKLGDRIILTKAVGTGVIATAIKGDLASPAAVDAMVNSICTLNDRASIVGARFGVRACTDVTGFGLVGHLVEMARASKCKVRLRSDAVPIMEGADEAAAMGLIPAGAYANREFFEAWTTLDSSVDPVKADLLFDPQTSGGLILGVKAAKASELVSALIGEGVEIAAEIGAVEAADPDGHLDVG